MGRDDARASPFRRGIRAAIHSHPHEQIGDVLAGEIDLIMEPMETMRLAAGSSSYVAPNVKHGIAPLAATILLDCLTPVREEFLEHERRRER